MTFRHGFKVVDENHLFGEVRVICRNTSSFPPCQGGIKGGAKEGDMAKLPGQYQGLQKRFRKFTDAVENLGKAAKDAGPLDEKTSHLVRLSAAAAIGSEGALHSHTRRALAAGSSPDEIYHAIILLTSTIGFPRVSAALSWADDILKKGSDRTKNR